MIIWTRWGIFGLLFIGVGALVAAGIAQLTGLGLEGSGFGLAMGIGQLISGALLLVFTRYVVQPHLDAPRPVMITQELAQPIVLPNGHWQTHRTVPAVHPETGQPIYSQPRSTFFFMSLRVWSFVMMAGGLLIAIICGIQVIG